MLCAILFGIAFEGQIIWQCNPISFFWSSTRDPKDGHCADMSIIAGFTYAHAAIASIGDWTLGILPIFMFKGLQMNKRAKVSVMLILALANIGSIATVVRIKTIHQITISTDFLYATIGLATWSSIEVGTAVPAISIATFRPLVRKFVQIGTANRGADGGGGSKALADAKRVSKNGQAHAAMEMKNMPSGHVHCHSSTSTTFITTCERSTEPHPWERDSTSSENFPPKSPWRVKQDIEVMSEERSSGEV